MIPGAASPESAVLPALREDIRLLPARASLSGAPQWMVFDPLAHAYYQLDLESFQLLSCWASARNVGDLLAKVEARHGRKPSLDEAAGMTRFLAGHRLTGDPAGGWRGLADAKARQRESPLRTLLHNYLFFKVPLLRPDAALRRTLPAVRLLASTPALVLIALLSLAGLFLASRRWEAFVGTCNDFWTPAGAAVFAGALLVLKLFHELAHAYVATARGCRVASMGVACMLGAPLPYTDVTDAWKLPRRRDRMAIDLAGVGVEAAIAGLATFAWVFLPDGPMRAVAFAFATTGWIMSLAVNLNPFMRFDGYFVLADLLNIPNLQPRSFALAKWRLRRTLFGAAEPAPDIVEGTLRSLVILYGFGVWLYRLVVFTGIALLVYHMAFKALGIVLFLVEIGVFIVMPVVRELRHWWGERRRYGATGRTALTALAFAGLVAAMIVPWSSTVTIPGALEPRAFSRVFPKAAGELVAVHAKQGGRVEAGAPLFTLEQPRLRKELGLIALRLALLQARIDRRAVDRKELAVTPQLEQERAALLTKREALLQEQENLIVRAPTAGILREISPTLHVGRSVSRDEELALVVADASVVVRGYVEQVEIWRLGEGVAGSFIPDDAQASPRPVRLEAISPVGARTIDIPILASVHGGKVETWQPAKNGDLTPVHASHFTHFEITGSIDATSPPAQVQRGVVRLQAAPESLAARALRQIMTVLVQESSF